MILNNKETYSFTVKQNKRLLEESTIGFDYKNLKLCDSIIELITLDIASNYLIDYELTKVLPTRAKYCFGLYFIIDNVKYLGGALIYSAEYGNTESIWKGNVVPQNGGVILSNGMCSWWTPQNSASYFINKTIKIIKSYKIHPYIVGYTSSIVNEYGTIFKALNFKYMGVNRGYFNPINENGFTYAIYNNVLRYKSDYIKELGKQYNKEIILEKYPNTIFIKEYRYNKWIKFIDSKSKNKKYLNHVIRYCLIPPKYGKIYFGIIYKITNIANGKLYIGQTMRSIFDRIGSYNLNKANDYIMNVFNKYGFDGLKYEIIDYAFSADELNKKEIDYIKLYNTTDRSIGYNIEFGGKNSKISQETREKMSRAGKGKKKPQSFIDKHPKAGSEEAKKYGRPKNEQEKEYLSKKLKEIAYWKGIKRDKDIFDRANETKLKNGVFERARLRYSKCVIVINIINGVIVDEFINAFDCSLKYTKYSNTQIAGRASGRSRNLDNMFYFYYKDDIDKYKHLLKEKVE